MSSSQPGKSNLCCWLRSLVWELRTKEFLNSKHGQESRNIYHFLCARYAADNVLSIYSFLTFLNPQKETTWDYFHFWGKRQEVWASQLISDKTGIKSKGCPRLHRLCASVSYFNTKLKLKCPQRPIHVGNHPVAFLLSFVNSPLIEIWAQINIPLPRGQKRKQSWIHDDASK